mgnify:CR=1 FL=1
MLLWLFWGLAALLGLVGIAVLVAGWELVRRHPHVPATPLPMRVHSIDLNLGVPTGPLQKAPVAVAASMEPGSPPTDSDARRRALTQAIERMSEPAKAVAGTASIEKEPWEDTRPRVNLPVVEPTPPA